MSDGFLQTDAAQRSPLELHEVPSRTRGELAKPLSSDSSAIARGAGAGEPVVPRHLPSAVAHFTGRTAELDALTRILNETDGGTAPGTVLISAIGGTAGIGKTALALHWAHQVAHRFPDGQLHVNLRGFDPSGTPMAPSDAIRGFLDALGVPPERIPRSTDAQAGLYRSLLTGKRMLIVLDNARDEQQVRPLLPASSGTLVLVTSRSQITGLAAAEGARVISLDALTHDEAVQMLTARLGAHRVSQEPAAVSEIAVLCAGLPLALSVVAARAITRPNFPLATLAAELRDTATRLDALDIGDPRASVQAVFSWSYDQLSPEAARMFRLTGLHPGPDVSVDAAASLSGTAPAEARHLLRELARGCLVTEHVPGRYTSHDLLRAYAARHARTTDSESDITAALERLFDHYAQATRASAILLYPSREMSAFVPAAPVVAIERPENGRQARAWLEAELPNLIASVGLAAQSGFDDHAWQLPWFLDTHLTRRGYWNEQVALQHTALRAATRLDDSTGQAMASRFLATAYMERGDYDRALSCYKTSARLCHQLGNRLGEAKAWHGIAIIAGREGRYADSLRYCEHTRLLYQALGHKAGEVKILISLAASTGGLGDLYKAREFCHQALMLARGIDNQYTKAIAWHSLAYAEQVLGNFPEAEADFQSALDHARKAGDQFQEADIFAHLGDIRHAAGSAAQALPEWSQALAILAATQHPDGDRVRAKLANPGQSASPPWCGLVRLDTTKITKLPAGDTIQLRRPHPAQRRR